MKRALLILAATQLTACAAHNAHIVELVPPDVVDGADRVAPLVDEAFRALVDDGPDALRNDEVAMAVEIDDVDAAFAADGALLEREELRERIEGQLVDLLGDALTTRTVDAAELRLDVWLLVDMGRIDAVSLRVACLLTHRDAPRETLAYGESHIETFERLRCFGCRDDFFGDTGTRLRNESRSGGVFLLGTGYYYGPYHNHYHSPRSTYTRVRN